jgi:O-methyltransferase
MKISFWGSNGKWRTSWFGRRLNRAVGFFELFMMKLYRKPEDFQMLNNLIKREKEFNFKPSEIFMIFSLARTKAGATGDFAEIGVFQGLSAEVICRAKGDNELWLFDTFEGMPQVGFQDTLFEVGTYKGSLEAVKNRLSPWKGVHIVKGLFPQSATPVFEKQFAFVHLDVDIYESTRGALEFFYDRMIKGGIIISHDYGQAAGVKRAFDEFFAGKKEKIIELPMSQCAVIKDF